MEKRNEIEMRTAENVIVSMRLADFPHGKLIGSKDYEDGRHVDFYEALPGVKVKAFDEATGKMQLADVSGWSEHRGCRTVIVNLSNGDQILTDDDPRAVYGIPEDSTTLVPSRFTPEEALKAKVMVPYVKRGIIAGTELPWYDLEKRIPVEHENAYCIPLDFDFGQFIGIMTGNGWWSHKDTDAMWQMKSLFLSDMKGYAADFVHKWMLSNDSMSKISSVSLSKDKYGNRYGDSTRHRMHGDFGFILHEFLNDNVGGEAGDNHRGAGSKHLPKWLSSAPVPFLNGLMCGLIATDGTVSTSCAKGKPQLLISYTTISYELAVDIQHLARMLGVKATISFSRHTTAGNSCWIINFSTPDMKRENVLEGMCHQEKLKVFTETKVSMDMTRNEYVPFPKTVSSVIVRWVRAPNAPAWMKDSLPEEYARRKEMICLYTILKKGETENRLPEGAAKRVVEMAIEQASLYPKAIDYVKKMGERLSSGRETRITLEDISNLLRSIDLLCQFTDSKTRNLAVRDLTAAVSNGGLPGRLGKLLPDLLTIDTYNPKGLSEEPEFVMWSRLVNGHFSWASIVSIEKTDSAEVSYDLTVPGYETFIGTNGVVLSNTMTYYVPVSDKAVKEAYKVMMPSKNLLAARDFKALPVIQEELVSGAFLATRKKNGPVKAVFNTKEEAVKAYKEGRIAIDDNIVIKGVN